MAGEEQAMTSERLVEMRQQIDLALAEPFCEGFTLREESDLLAEVERLRKREAALSAVVRAVANGTTPTRHANYLIFGVVPGVELRKQARALLASVGDSERSGGDGG